MPAEPVPPESEAELSPSRGSGQGRPRRRRRKVGTDLRVWILGFLFLCAMGGIVAKLWWVQVARGEEYAKKIAGRSQVRVRIPSVRGEIRDRNGVPLVQNRASYDVDFYLPYMVRGYK